jgi:hypothetical protein
LKTTEKNVPIFSQKLCGELLTKGFVLQGTAPNNKSPNKSVFYFKDSEALRCVMSEYTSVKI